MRYPQYELFHRIIPLEMCIINSSREIIYYNKTMSESAEGDDLQNKKIEEFIILESFDDYNHFFQLIKEGKANTEECRLFGQTRFVKSIYNEKTCEIYLVFTPIKIDSASQHTDILTGLPTRQIFFDRATQLIYRCERHNQKMAVIFLDLDGFKPVNDTYGHKAGDIVLKVISERMENSLRKTDTVARFGGDEFILALSELKEAIHASLGAKRILKIIEKPINIGDREVSVSASIGISIFPDDGKNIKELLKKADAAMYEAKTNNRGYSFFNMQKFLD
ncbi:MAG: diguanylate cyclase [Desulfobacteraceae bacterium]